MKTQVAVSVLLLSATVAAQDSGPSSKPGSVPVRLCPSCGTQDSAAKPEQARQPAAAQAETEPPDMALVAELPHPEKYAVAFLPVKPGDEGFAFLVAPNGRVGTVPMAKLGEAFKAGYRPFTVEDLLAVTNAVAEDETKLQKRYKELSEDYDALVARYNRLAAVQAATPVQAQPAVDERQVMRAVLFRALLQRAFPPLPSQILVQTVDCTKFPALCVSH